jgi:histone deacetylase-like protein
MACPGRIATNVSLTLLQTRRACSEGLAGLPRHPQRGLDETVDAGRSTAGCVFNNVAIAASHALSAGMAPIAVIDIDAHHGNGTQEVFYHSVPGRAALTHGDMVTALASTSTFRCQPAQGAVVTWRR